jgi:ATP-dependent DNA ligase
MTQAYQIPPAQCDGSYPAAVAMGWKNSPDFVCEEKINGLRALLQIQPGQARSNFLTGRRRVRATGEFMEFQDRFPLIRDHAFPRQLAGTVLDGELAEGVFWYFDLIMLKGRLITHLPLRERRRKLAELAAAFPAWMRPVASSPCAAELLREVTQRGGEGIVRKNLNECYGFAWTKAKLEETFDVIILSADRVSRTLRIGQMKNGRKIDMGWVGGLSDEQWAEAAAHVGEAGEIFCQNRDESGRFHRAHWLRLRPDKAPEDCVYDGVGAAAGKGRRPAPAPHGATGPRLTIPAVPRLT